MSLLLCYYGVIIIEHFVYPNELGMIQFVPSAFRILVAGIGPSQNENCRSASEKICKAVLGNADFQLGKTKVFLKVKKET